MATIARPVLLRAVCALIVVAAALASGCDRRVYVVDGVTDGQTFYILPSQLEDESPVVQSWIAYSLARSACQLQRDEVNPARANDYGCELSGREALILTWRAYRADPGVHDDYLDALVVVEDAGFLREYVWVYLARKRWTAPGALQIESFEAWRRVVLAGHKVQTRLIGAWI